MADQSMRDYGLAAPHGPNMTGDHVATADIGDMSNAESSVFKSLLQPPDSYDENGVYWADMGIMRRAAFTRKVDNAEARRELSSLWRMIKADPLSPIHFYMRNMVIPGAGLLLEGYVLFSIGNNSNLFDKAFPNCWDAAKSKHPVCNPIWVDAVVYLEVVGIIVGQILVGYLGDYLGRRYGLIQDATIMFIGLVMLSCSWGVTLNGWIICYAWSLFVYGIGVGGEYPMTATSGMENAVGSGKVSTQEDRLHRGRKVISAFLMQGWGQFFNQAILIILLLIFNGTHGNAPYDRTTAQWVFRIAFVIPALGTLWLLYYRIFKMRSASKQLQIAKLRQHVTGYDVQSLKLTVTYFGPRLVATAGGWFANDVFFYGNKLFQSQFLSVLFPTADVTVTWLWNLVNIGVELAGYYLASFMADHKMYGRKWMQIIGFLVIFITFVIPAFDYKYYSAGPGIHSFQAMYYISSFFGQFGPNCVTFLVAAEVYPTPIRASAHGFSAAIGKLGALVATIAFNYLTTSEQKYKFVPWFGLLGALLTFLFLPDTTGLDLKEQERRWAFIRAGRANEYHGVAVHPKHLSYYERWTGVGKTYNAEQDYQQRVEEMRVDWEQAMERRAAEKTQAEQDLEMDDDWSSEVSTFFERTRGGRKVPANGNGHATITEEKQG